NVANRSERYGEIAREGSNVGPLADDCLAIGVVLIEHRDQSQLGDLHGPAWQSGWRGGSSQGIGASAADLDSGICRGRLQNRAGEAGQYRLDLLAARPRGGLPNNRALAIVGSASSTPADAEA